MKKLVLIFCFALTAPTSLLAQCNSWLEASSLTSPHNTRGLKIVTDADDNVYCSGVFTGNIAFGNDTLTNSFGGFSYYINKFNNNHVLQWALQLETNVNYFLPAAICQKNGYLYVAGVYHDTLITNAAKNTMLVAPGNNFFMLKLDLNGNVLLAKNYAGGKDVDSIYFTWNDVGSIAINNLNQLYFTGSFIDTFAFAADTFISNGGGAFLTKTDSNGNVIWAVDSKIDAGGNCWGSTVAVDGDNNVILCGGTEFEPIVFGTKIYTYSSIGYVQTTPYVAKFDSSGTCLWVTGFQQSLFSMSSLNGLAIDLQNNIYTGSNISMGLSDGDTTLLPENGSAYYCKFSPSGNLIWLKQTAFSDSGWVVNIGSIATDSTNHLWMCGNTVRPTILGGLTTPDTSVFIIELDTGGTILNGIAGKGITSTRSVALGTQRDIYVSCLGVTNYLEFNGDTINNQYNFNTTDTAVDVILRYCLNDAGINKMSTNDNQLSIYPNPTSGTITITSSKNINNITVTNLVGQIILKSLDERVNKQTIDLSNFSAGMYFITITTGDKTTTQKIILDK